MPISIHDDVKVVNFEDPDFLLCIPNEMLEGQGHNLNDYLEALRSAWFAMGWCPAVSLTRDPRYDGIMSANVLWI